MTIKTIPAPVVTDPKNPPPCPVPPCTGNWLRGADGSLTPADEATARTAGLWEEPAAPAAPQAPTEAPE